MDPGIYDSEFRRAEREALSEPGRSTARHMAPMPKLQPITTSREDRLEQYLTTLLNKLAEARAKVMTAENELHKVDNELRSIRGEIQDVLKRYVSEGGKD